MCIEEWSRSVLLCRNKIMFTYFLVLLLSYEKPSFFSEQVLDINWSSEGYSYKQKLLYNIGYGLWNEKNILIYLIIYSLHFSVL